MELLSFKIKIFELLSIEKTEEIGEKLLDVVLNNKTEVFDSFKEISDDRKDWLQALWQYYEAEFSATKTIQEIAESDYLLKPSRYIEFKEQESEHRPFQDIADNLNFIVSQQNACKLIINETIAKSIGLDVERYVKDREASKQSAEDLKKLGIELAIYYYIQFTKNKNEFVFKCNDKELLPEILLEFFSLWKSRIILLNSMQEQYLAELRDALLPDLMSGKIDLGAMKDEERI